LTQPGIGSAIRNAAAKKLSYMTFTLTLLGTGTSHGVPMIGCSCSVCRSSDPRDRHLRSAAWLHTAGTSVIIDVGPDLREQAIRQNIKRIDAVFLTHTHADHLHGIDDLRGFTRLCRQALPFYARKADTDFIRSHFDYIFNDGDFKHGWFIPRLDLRALDGSAPVQVGELSIQPVPLIHGHGRSTGYRIGNVAYLTDCSAIPESSYPLLQGLDSLVIDGLRWTPHYTHLCFEQAIAEARRLQVPKTYLTHLTHDIAYAETQSKLPPGVFLAYDGLNISGTLK
jgi:phosphoribosyl 1,2-cyclic phosphate phosphodiesterase